MELTETGVEKFYIVGQLGHGAHGGTGCAHRVFAVNGYSGRNVLYGLHMGPVHALHELSRIGRKGLNIATLALSVEGIKGKGGLS